MHSFGKKTYDFVTIAPLQKQRKKALSGVDLAILSVVLVSALVGLLRGFIKEVFALLNWVVALVLAYLFKDPVGAILPLGESVSPLIRSAVGGILIFVLTLIVGGLLVTLIHKLVQASGLSGTDRTLGVVFGILRGCVIVLALLILLPAVSPVEDQAWWQASISIPLFLGFEEWATTLMTDLVNWVTGRVSG